MADGQTQAQAPDTISISDFIRQSYGAQGVPSDLQQGYQQQLEQYFPTGQIPTAATGAAFSLLNAAPSSELRNVYGAILQNYAARMATGSSQPQGAGGLPAP